MERNDPRFDTMLLADLSPAFDSGRRPGRVDLHELAAAVTARGVPARVLSSGGGTATLYTGGETVDAYGDVRFSASAGPGFFDSPTRDRAFADLDEFGVGPHDTSWAIAIPEHATLDEIADLIVAVTADADAQLSRFAGAVAAARTAMWTALRAAYPQAHSTGLPADLDTALVTELRCLLATWLERYWPDFHTSPAHLATRDGDADDRPTGGERAG